MIEDSESVITRISELWKSKRTNVRQVSEWMLWKEIPVYIRVGRTYIPKMKDFRKSIVIANIAMPPKKQGKGIFTELLMRILNEFGDGVPVLIENVLNKEFADSMMRHGFRNIRKEEKNSVDSSFQVQTYGVNVEQNNKYIP